MTSASAFASSSGPLSRPPVVRLSSPADLVAAVPYLLGFVPTESLVLLGQRPPRGRVEVTVRVDLPAGTEDIDALIAAVGDKLAGAGATSAVAVVLTQRGDEGGDDAGAGGRAGGRPALPAAEVVTALRARLAARGVELRDALLARDGVVRSYCCTDPRCCPPEGLPVPAPGDGPLAAHAVLAGRVVRPDRDAVVAAVAPAGADVLDAVRVALDRAVDELVVRFADGTTARAVRAETMRAWELAQQRVGRGEHVGTPSEVARLLLGLADTTTRDAVLVGLVDGGAEQVGVGVEALRTLVREAVPPYVAPVAAMLAWAAYLDGDGTLAGCALDRALGEDPRHGLARLVAAALDAGAHPDVLRATARASADEVRARLAAGSAG